MRNRTDLGMVIPVTSEVWISRISRLNGSQDVPLISSTRHLSIPHPSASSRMTLAPKDSRSLMHSAREEAQSSAEINVYVLNQNQQSIPVVD